MAGGTDPRPERAVARIDLGAIERNCAHLRSLTGPGTELCVVVKADGYGHGAVPAGRAALAGGASWLAVAAAAEAAELRDGGIDAPLLVMGALTRDDLDAALAARADVVAWTPELVDALGARGGPARVHVKLDSGMGRLGTRDPDEARALCERVAGDERLELAGLMTHFATADEPGDEHFPDQLRSFAPLAREVRERWPGTPVHAANSAATYRDPAAHFDMVRCGIAAYGLDPFHEDPARRGLEPALALHSYVAAVKRFEAGASAGYGRTWRAGRPTCVGVLPIGYGDGVRRALSNNARVLVRGRSHLLVGTVSMDNVTIDLGPETDVKPGDPAVLIGEQGGERILAEEVAAAIGTINYEVTCGLTARTRREHGG
ncbi:MAG TPA: alanine racemase [Thermoleophilaceae bacterium]|jgi:alanine racemase